MSFYYLMPVTQQNITVGNQTVQIVAPKYLQSDMAGADFSCIPYGGEGWCVVVLEATNAALANEPDVYAFPSLSSLLQDSDVSTLTAFLAQANVPSSQIVAGMTFGDALAVILKIFLTVQAMFGATGQTIFSGGVTLSSAVSDTTLSALVPSQTSMQSSGKIGMGLGSSQPPESQVGPFDLSVVSASDSLGDTLDAVSQQFASQIVIGSESVN